MQAVFLDLLLLLWEVKMSKKSKVLVMDNSLASFDLALRFMSCYCLSLSGNLVGRLRLEVCLFS